MDWRKYFKNYQRGPYTLPSLVKLGVSFEVIVEDAQQSEQMTNKGHPMITQAHIVPMAQVS